jgi:hypothetical protein
MFFGEKIMDKRILLLAVVLCLQAVGNAYTQLDIRPGNSWEFIQSVGGIKVGTPTRGDNDQVFLPVLCDVSGLTEITCKPTKVNSALHVQLLTAWVKANQIQITLRSGLVGDEGSPRCGSVQLGALDSGDYDVYYVGSDKEQHFLSRIKVPW